MKKWSIVIAIIMVIFISGVAIGITMYQEKVAGLGKWQFTNEATIEEIEPEVEDNQVIVKILPTVNTEADHSYTVTLYLDDTEFGTLPVSWTTGEITGSTRKTITFTGTDLSGTNNIEIKVTY